MCTGPNGKKNWIMWPEVKSVPATVIFAFLWPSSHPFFIQQQEKYFDNKWNYVTPFLRLFNDCIYLST